MNQKSRVFISCGQRKDTEEHTLAKQIADKLTAMGFEPYVATTQQSLKGVKENIFKTLENSEYFLFVDFKRERLFKTNGEFVDTRNHRGSLFSHQELAIAAFSDYDVLAFQEEGVKKDDGILKFIQANCIPFSERSKLPSLVAKKVRERKWDPTWRNELELSRNDNDFEDEMTTRGLCRFFHIKVLNKHKDKISRNCVAFAERMKNLQNNKTRVLDLVELKWKRIKTVGVFIPPQSLRCFDAVKIFYSDPSIVHLGLNNLITDWGPLARGKDYEKYQISGLGDYEIDYVVFSDDFSPARAKFLLHLDKQIQDSTFELITT